MSSTRASPERPWDILRGPGPVVATAVHAGHDLRPEVALEIALSDDERRLEEDPHTGEWASVGDSSVVVHRSRFEVDLNRSREQAVYLQPADAWGLHVWKGSLPAEVAEGSRALHDRF